LYKQHFGIYLSIYINLIIIFLDLVEGKGISFCGIISNEIYTSMRKLMDPVPVEHTSLKDGFTVAIYDKENPLAQKFVEILKKQTFIIQINFIYTILAPEWN